MSVSLQAELNIRISISLWHTVCISRAGSWDNDVRERHLQRWHHSATCTSDVNALIRYKSSFCSPSLLSAAHRSPHKQV